MFFFKVFVPFFEKLFFSKKCDWPAQASCTAHALEKKLRLAFQESLKKGAKRAERWSLKEGEQSAERWPFKEGGQSAARWSLKEGEQSAERWFLKEGEGDQSAERYFNAVLFFNATRCATLR